MCLFVEICAGIFLKVSESLKAYMLQAIAANEDTDCRFVLNSKEIERFFVDMHMKISLRAASAYLLKVDNAQSITFTEIETGIDAYINAKNLRRIIPHRDSNPDGRILRPVVQPLHQILM